MICRWHSPVSYTHLDVYKRQYLDSCLWRRLFGNLIIRIWRNVKRKRRNAAVSYTHLDVYKRQAQEVDETWYYARKYMEGRECETRSRDDVLAAVEELAKLHLVLQKVEDENLKIGGQDYAMEVFRHNRELKKVRNYICLLYTSRCV